MSETFEDRPPDQEKVSEPVADIRQELRGAREMIPVGPRGATLMNFQQQIDYAQSMAKAIYSLPEFLRNNVGDCLAIIDIASRADLSPYMLAMKTYLEPKSKKLCFESQAYHALAMPWIKGDFEIEYEGDGEDMVCVISGYLKNDPQKRRTHRSEALAKARPSRNADGVTKGSPLWDKKKRVQLAYDTMRDWVRLYAPRATLGIYTPDEDFSRAENARDVTRISSEVPARVAAAGRGEEGFVEGHAERELSQIAPASVARAEKPAAKSKRASSVTTDEAPKDGQDNDKAAPGATTDAPKDQGERGDEKPEAEKAAPAETPPVEVKAAAQPDIPPATPETAKTWQEYKALWAEIIKSATSAKIIDAWKAQRSIREALQMPADEVSKLRDDADAKVAALKKAAKKERVTPMQWSEQQSGALSAVKKWLHQRRGPQVFRLFGYAGVGKTTIARETLNMTSDVLFASFTGKAALVMRRKGCAHARTIHSLIYLPIEEGGGEVSFALNPDSEAANADLIVVDEVSMVGPELGKDLLSFGTKILVLGDPAQLPPIKGAGFFTAAEPNVMLTEIHRQAAGNPIIAMATTVRSGGCLSLGEYGLSRVIRREEMTTAMLMSADQVIVGTHVTRRGVNTKMRRTKFAGLFPDETRLPKTPVDGDRLVCLKNNRKRGLLNGSLWDAVDIKKPAKKDHGVTRAVVETADDESGRRLDIGVPNEFFLGDDAAVKNIPWPKRKALDEFDFGYALTCHKSQGSQWDDVMVLDQSGVFREQRQRWLYTAVTRAAERVVVVKPSEERR